jgi:hypothetical protein
MSNTLISEIDNNNLMPALGKLPRALSFSKHTNLLELTIT